MAKPTLDFYDQNFVPFSAANYSVMIADYPDIGPMAATVEMPKLSINQIDIDFMGSRRTVPGRNPYENRLPITLLCNRQTNLYQQLFALYQSYSDGNTGNLFGSDFTLRVVQYDDIGIEAQIWTFKNCWLPEVGSFSLGGDQDSIVSLPCVFVYNGFDINFNAMSDAGQAVVTNVMR